MAWIKSRSRWGGFVVSISTTVQPTLLISTKDINYISPKNIYVQTTTLSCYWRGSEAVRLRGWRVCRWSWLACTGRATLVVIVTLSGARQFLWKMMRAQHLESRPLVVPIDQWLVPPNGEHTAKICDVIGPPLLMWLRRL